MGALLRGLLQAAGLALLLALTLSAPERSGPGQGGGDGSGGGRWSSAPVRVDGQQVAVLRFSDLPEGLAPRWVPLQDGRLVRRYSVAEYVESLGVPLERVREIRLWGGRERSALLAGDELRRLRSELLFDFTQSTRGKPRMAWPGQRIQVNDRIDLIAAIDIRLDAR